MNKEDTDNLLKAIIAKNGHWPQIEMLTEEIGETLQALNKLKRTGFVNDRIKMPAEIDDLDYSLKYFAVCSELADMEILLEQMRKIFCSQAIDLARDRKLNRQKERMFKRTLSEEEVLKV